MKSIELIGKYYLGAGGIGDALLFLSTFYDEVEEANVIFLANNTNSIKELLDCFPKIKKKLIIHNEFHWLYEFYHHPNCIGTGILPKNLDYSNWHKVDIFKEYGVKEFPNFLSMFEPVKVDNTKKQLFVQHQGSNVEGNQKQRILLQKTILEVHKEFLEQGYYYVGCDETYCHKPLKQVISEIRGSDVVVSVDSFAKTISAMSKIRTIVYDNIYDDEYLAKFKDGIDYGHEVFIFPWSYIEFRIQKGNEEYKKAIERAQTRYKIK